MCQECGCNELVDEEIVTELDATSLTSKTLIIDKNVLQANDSIAVQIEHFMQDRGVFCINLLGSPGSGKTSVIEQLAKYIPTSDIVVIQGDLESDIDKVRLEKIGILTYQINTHSGCHLNAMMINRALLETKIDGKKFLIIENVGNLVCPAGVKIGQAINIVVSSVTEGSDKPKKYPYIFMDAKIILISKADLSSMVEFDEARYLTDLRHINGLAKIFAVSPKDGMFQLQGLLQALLPQWEDLNACQKTLI